MTPVESILPLLLAAVGMRMILFGWAGVGKLLRLLFAPIGCLIKAVVTVAVVLAVGLLLLARQFDVLRDLPASGLRSS